MRGGDVRGDALDILARALARARARWRAACPRARPISGMTLLVVPAVTRPTVTTTGSNTLWRRVTMFCSARPISNAAGIGSIASCGAEAWPPRPLTVISPAVGRGHDRPGLAGEHAGLDVGNDVHGEAGIGLRRGLDQPVLDHEARAVIALLAGLEHELHRAGEIRRGGDAADAPRAPASRCARHGRRHAFGRRSRSNNGRPVSSGIGSASVSPRSRMVLPATPALACQRHDQAGGAAALRDLDIEAAQFFLHHPVGDRDSGGRSPVVCGGAGAAPPLAAASFSLRRQNPSSLSPGNQRRVGGNIDRAPLFRTFRSGAIKLFRRLDHHHAAEAVEPARADALERAGRAQDHARFRRRHEQRRVAALRRELRVAQQPRQLRMTYRDCPGRTAYRNSRPRGCAGSAPGPESRPPPASTRQTSFSSARLRSLNSSPCTSRTRSME